MRRDNEETAEFDDVICTAETDKALLCVIDGKGHWIPLSQVHDDSEVYRKGDEGRLVLTMWIALQKGLV